MTDSRTAILADIAAALRRPSPHHHQAPAPPPGPGVPIDWSDPVGVFEKRFTEVGGHWHHPPTRALVLDAVLTIVRQHDARAVLVAEDRPGLLDSLRLAESLRQQGVQVARRLDDRNRADDFEVMITGVDAALAETGTLAFMISPGQGRLATIVCPVHVVLLERARVVRGLGEFLTLAKPLLASGEVSGSFLVTGPSRTGDIELTLTVGVHGPGTIHVVLVD